MLVTASFYRWHREVNNLLRVTRFIKAKLGFKLDPHKHAFSRRPRPTPASRVYHKNLWQCLWNTVISLQDRPAQGCSLDRMFSWNVASSCHSDSHCHSEGSGYSSPFSPPQELVCKWRVVRELRKDTWLFAHCLSQLHIRDLIFVFLTALGDRNFYLCFIGDTG